MTIVAEILALQKMSVAQLKEKWREVYGEEPRSHHRTFLWKRLARKIQEIEFGGLSEEAKMTKEFEAKLSVGIPDAKKKAKRPSGIRDKRLPMPGTIITRDYRGERVEVTVLEKGFEYQGRLFRSLSAIAQEVTGAHWNGYLFFGLA